MLEARGGSLRGMTAVSPSASPGGGWAWGGSCCESLFPSSPRQSLCSLQTPGHVLAGLASPGIVPMPPCPAEPRGARDSLSEGRLRSSGAACIPCAVGWLPTQPRNAVGEAQGL